MKRSLVIHDLEKYTEALDFNYANVEHIEPRHQLPNQINYLLTGNFFEAEELHLSDDGNHSFRFWFTKNGERHGIDGGIILHGHGESYSVTLSPADSKYFWQVHT